MSLRLSSSNSPNDDLRLGSVSVQWAWLGDAPVWLPFANKLLGRELFVPVVLVWYRCFLSLILSILRPLRIYLSAPGMQSTLYITNKSLPTTVQS